MIEGEQALFGERRNELKGEKGVATRLLMHQLQAALRLLRWKLRDRRLFSNDELQFGNKIDDELTVRIQRVPKGVTPGSEVGLALGEKGPDEALKGLRERGIGDVPLVLIELARGEQAARRNEPLMQLIDDGGLANTRISGDQHQLRSATLDDAVERGEQGLDLALSSVKFLRNQ